MKKLNVLTNAATSLIIVGMSVVLFTGCQSKTAQTTTTPAPTNTTASTKPNAADMKKKMSDNVSALVTAGTINQSQADKILEALTANQKSGGNKKSQNGQSATPSTTPSTTPPTTQPNGTGGNTSNRKRPNPLAKLVTDKVITQAQSDAVMLKVRGNFGQPKSN